MCSASLLAAAVQFKQLILHPSSRISKTKKLLTARHHNQQELKAFVNKSVLDSDFFFFFLRNTELTSNGRKMEKRVWLLIALDLWPFPVRSSTKNASPAWMILDSPELTSISTPAFKFTINCVCVCV